MTSLTQTIHELAGKGTQGLMLTATPLFGALALERQLVLSTPPFVVLNLSCLLFEGGSSCC